MNKVKPVVVRNPAELAKAFRLPPTEAVELDVRSRINDKIIAVVKHSGLTHAQVAKLAGTLRTRLTAILNHDRKNVSTDLMLRILAALGYRAKVSFQRERTVA